MTLRFFWVVADVSSNTANYYRHEWMRARCVHVQCERANAFTELDYSSTRSVNNDLLKHSKLVY